MSEEAFAAAAQQIGAHAADVQTGVAAGNDDLAASVAAGAPGGTGVTETDIAAIMAQIKDMQDRLAASEAQRAADRPPALVSTATTLRDYVAVHNDPEAVELANSLVEAAQNSTESGDTGPLSKIADRLARHLRRHPPYPGENHHFKAAVDWAENHMADAIDSFTPPSSAVAVSGRAPVNVVQGTRVG
jgi:hypothetical protein